jgi:hypothetical protein
MRVKFHPEARIDLKQGKAFYRSRSPLAAVAFAQEIDAAFLASRSRRCAIPLVNMKHANAQRALHSWIVSLIDEAVLRPAAEREELLNEAERKCLRREELLPGSGAYALACVYGVRGDERNCRVCCLGGSRTQLSAQSARS